ncbi:hypothetical protein [Bradyrhizobium sp. JYMT SZCCT0180]|uniref:hypothetical protein n=1 Tax=Bradyrhizobium sp. JYMT SZCCT0180 TaxID=2807666 RepID=UPI001BAE238D|nr:hypothetical protein [Bradyrhizobium sp. JYMT SZCCT0180]MBR1214636.1 hypothetical protein [Bradyrhizobium sp. JYMT SZCCT0180]
MTAMSISIVCTNFGDCRVADDKVPLWSELLVACPNCGKSLASPHRVTLQPIAGSVRENKSVPVVVNVKLGNRCFQPGKLALEVDRKEIGDAQHVAGEPKDYQFEIEGRHTGIYRVRAVLQTSDGRITMSSEELLLVAQPSNLIAPLLWALLLILLLCLSSSLGWFGKPLFGWVPHPSLSYAADGVSVISALLIGGLLLDLGRRERAFGREDAGLLGQHRSLVRFQSYDQLSDKFPYSNRILNRVGEKASSGAALITLGALPICFAFAYLAGIAFGTQRPWATIIAFVVTATGIFFVVRRTELKGSRGETLMTLPQADAPSPMIAVADPLTETMPAQSAGSVAAMEAPNESAAQPNKDKA